MFVLLRSGLSPASVTTSGLVLAFQKRGTETHPWENCDYCQSKFTDDYLNVFVALPTVYALFKTQPHYYMHCTSPSDGDVGGNTWYASKQVKQ